MPQSTEYHKLMTEIVSINLPGPREPVDGMTGGELLHGFLADLYTKDGFDYVHLRTSIRKRKKRHNSQMRMWRSGRS